MPLQIDLTKLRRGTELVKRGFAKMQQGGVIMDVTNAEQAKIAEEAGAVAVMALERVPADIRAHGGVARMADPLKIVEIMDTVTIPVMAKARIGHKVEAQILESLGVDMIDESEVLTPADPFGHIDKRGFAVPFVCGARDLGEALRRIQEGAAMVRTKGEAGTGNVVEAVRHMHMIMGTIRELKGMSHGEMERVARKLESPLELVIEVAELQRLPVINFAAGGIATPADAALMMQMGADGVFVGSGIFKADNPQKRARSIVEAVAHFDEPAVLAEASKGLGDAMRGIEISNIPPGERLQERGH
ncbi:MAG: pyridoxal 5'-phosphate synthase lyase subunit PdxS [Euryarchaeota archaeon]|nr:pyridoxal 5'-phosphate synthase lyase subunit PdxS [Euryarchaeota archaeon]